MSEIEEKFYKCFGIVKITNNILLQLICIYMGLPEIDVFLEPPTFEELKEDVLLTLINNADTLIGLDDNEQTVYRAVRKLFKEEQCQK